MQPKHLALWVGQIAEDDRSGGTCLLTGRLDLAVADRRCRILRGDLCRLDPLHAVGAFFHDPAATDGHLRIVFHLGDFVGRVFQVLVEVEVVEATHLIGAVVCTVSGADASVVDHVVEPLVAMGGRGHRANLFAGGQFALLTGQRLIGHLGIGRVASEVPIHPQPVHLSPLDHLFALHHRDVVLGLTGHHACRAADAF